MLFNDQNTPRLSLNRHEGTNVLKMEDGYRNPVAVTI